MDKRYVFKNKNISDNDLNLTVDKNSIILSGGTNTVKNDK